MRADPEQEHRSSVLTYLLAGLVLMFCILVLVILTGGLFLYVVAVGGGIVLVGAFHYFLWGKMLSDEVAVEREEAELHRRAAEDEADYRSHFGEPRSIRRR
jgi:hypothetical protein